MLCLACVDSDGCHVVRVCSNICVLASMDLPTVQQLMRYVRDVTQARMGKQAEKLKKDIEGLETRLTSKGFADKAPPNVIAEVRGKVAEMRDQLTAVEKSISDMQGK
jgi:valyl-tRNA synthetase